MQWMPDRGSDEKILAWTLGLLPIKRTSERAAEFRIELPQKRKSEVKVALYKVPKTTKQETLMRFSCSTPAMLRRASVVLEDFCGCQTKSLAQGAQLL